MIAGSAAISLLLGGAQKLQAGIVSDPSFETQAVVGGQQEVSSGGTIGGAWTVSGLVTFYDNANTMNPKLTASDGNQAVLLRGDGLTFAFTTTIDGSVSQVVSVTPGASYHLVFSLGAVPATPGTSASVEVQVGFPPYDSFIFQDFPAAAPGTSMSWQPEEFEFTVPANETSAKIIFSGLGFFGTSIAPGAVDAIALLSTTTTAVSSSHNPSVIGQSVTFTATVSGSGGTPTGTVQFKIDGGDFGPAVALSGGSATSSATTTLALGNHTVTAVYSGDPSFTTSTGTLAGGQTVNCAPTIYVSPSGNDGNDGTSGSPKKTIEAGIAAACPGGTVYVKAGTYAPTVELDVNKDLTIIGGFPGDGPGATIVSGSANGGKSVFVINTVGAIPGPTVFLRGLTVQNGNALTGGGIYNYYGTLTVAGCTVTGNQAQFSGGGIHNRFGSTIVANSTINGNQGTDGAGIDNEAGTVTVANSTVSGNQATYDGGIANFDSLVVANSTITGNRGSDAAKGIGGISAYAGGTLYNSIVAGNFSGAGSTASDIGGGNVTTASHNLIGNAGSSGGIANNVNGNIVGVSVASVLDTTLANNGGPTMTHALVPGSPAIDAGDNSLIPQDYGDQNSNGNTTESSPDDQRGPGFPGFPRIFNSTVDIGAVEAGCPTITGTVTGGGAICNGGSAVVTVTVSGGGKPPYTVTLDNGVPSQNGPGPTFTFSVFPTRSTTYQLDVDHSYDANDCKFTGSGSATVGVNVSSVTVMNTDDSGPGSLRAAIRELCDGGTITFAPALNNQTITLTSGELVIDKSLTITGPGASLLTVSGNNASRVFSVGQNAICIISGLTIANGNGVGASQSGSAGAILCFGGTTLTLNDCAVINNSCGNWGAIGALNASLFLNRVTVSGNVSDNVSGIYLQDAGAFIRDSTISGNSGAAGDAVRLNVVSLFSSTLTMINSTISGNTTSSGVGSALTVQAVSGLHVTTATLESCTITGNNVVGSGQPGAIWVQSVPEGPGLATLILHDSIVSGNLSGGAPSDITGTADASSTYNLIGTGGGLTGGVGGNQIGVNDPKLGPLANNGGSTLTHALRAGSPAIDAGDPAFNPNNFTPALNNDQRGSGFPRVFHSRVDIGAFELSSSLSAVGGFSVTGSEGTALSSQTVATFTDSNGSDNVANYSAAIDWGDGSTGLGAITLSDSIFTVKGTHTYTEEGTYTITVSLTHGASFPVSATSTATISDPSVNATGGFTVTATAGVAFSSQTVATFTDPGGAEGLADYSATVKWADGTPDDTGAITFASGTFTVKGSHTYAVNGSYTITVIIHHEAAEDATVTSSASVAAQTPDYTVSTTGGAIVVTDVAGNSDTLNTTEPSAGNIEFAASGRTFRVDGGALITGNSGVLSLTGINSITVNAGAGNDLLNVGAFAGLLPNLTLNGGTGDDTISFNGSITFAANASLDVDLQNDDPVPGTDRIRALNNVQVKTSGTGTITMKCSRSIFLAGASLETVDGGITLEANQQATPTTGDNFAGVRIDGANALVTSSGKGPLNMKGRGGNGAGILNDGILVINGGQVTATASAPITLDGTAGAGAPESVANCGVDINNGAAVESVDGNIGITGQGGGDGTGSGNVGIRLILGSVTSTGAGAITLDGTGGTGDNCWGVSVEGAGAKVSTSQGNIEVTGHGGGTGSSEFGVNLANHGSILAGGTASITVNGTASSAGTGAGQVGIEVTGSGSQVTGSGAISLIGTGGTASVGNYNAGVLVELGGQVMAKDSGTITIVGTGGSGTSENYGVDLEGSPGLISTVNGDVSVTGVAGAGGLANNSFAATIGYPGNPAESLVSNGTGNLKVTADSVRVVTTSATLDFGANSVNFLPKTPGFAVNLGGDDSATALGFTDAELDTITCGTLTIGDSTTGDITVTAPLSPANAAALSLISGGTIANTYTAGTDVTTPDLTTSGALAPGASPGVFSVAGNETLADNSAFDVQIGGTTAGTEYDQLSATGTVTIGANVSLNLSAYNGFSPGPGQSFTIISRAGGSGTFASLAEGASLANFLGSAFSATITYAGGAGGHDVVLSIGCVSVTGTVSGGGGICSGGSATVTVAMSGGAAPYTVNLSNGGGSQTGKGPIFNFPVSPAAATTYQVAITSQDANGCPITGSGSATVTLNDPPSAGTDTLGTTENTAVNAPIPKLLINDSSPIGGTLSIMAVSATSAQGGTVALNGSSILYTPPANYSGADRFTYTLSDTRCTAQGTVLVTVTSEDAPSLNVISITHTDTPAPPANHLVFAGIPGDGYVIQWASSPTGPWADLSPLIQADSTGRITYTDTNPPSPRFYRTRASAAP